MPDSESGRGGGAAAATQESRSRSQGEQSPVLGTWRKEKPFPGAGSDRDTTLLRAPQTGPGIKENQAPSGMAAA